MIGRLKMMETIASFVKNKKQNFVNGNNYVCFSKRHLPVACTLYSAVGKDLQVEMSCIIFLNYCYVCCFEMILLFI